MRARRRLLGSCVLAYFGVRVAQVVVGPVVPGIRSAFGVSTGAVGAALTGMWSAYALAQVPSGLLSARIGERRVVLAALGLAGAGSALLAVAPGFPAFAAAAVALGGGAGLYYNAGTALLVERFEGTGRAIGYHRVGGQVAGVVAPAAAAAVGTRLGWRPALLLGAAAAAPALAAFARGVEPGDAGRDTDGIPDGTALRGIVGPALVGGTLLATLGEFVGVAASSLLPAFLVDFRGLSVERAGILFSGYFLAVAATQPASGWATGRFGRRPTTTGAFLAGAGGYALLVTGPPITLLPGIVLAAAAMGWNAPVQAGVLSRLGGGERRAGFGAFRTVYILLGALGSAVVGVTADLSGWAVGYGLLAGVLLAGAAAALVVGA